MAKFKQKDVEIEAVEITQEMIDDIEKLPFWAKPLVSGRWTKRYRDGELHSETKDFAISGPSITAAVQLRPGNWLVLTAGQRVRHFSDEEFDNYFEADASPVEAEKGK